MVYSYFPGCTLKTKAKDLDAYARRSAEALGVTLEELPEWQCCGAVYPIAQDEIATRLSSVRALNSAKELGRPLLTLCRYNLYTNRKEGHPPVYYFTELLAEALGVKEAN